jgi:hypothetical protein
MSAPVIELAGLAVRAPVTALTNAMLATECVAFASVMRGRFGIRSRLWAHFFLFLGLGALAGVPKHGIPEGVFEGVRLAARIVSNAGIGLATTTFVVLSIGATVARPRTRRFLTGVALLQLVTFLVLTTRHTAFTLVVANIAIGIAIVVPCGLRTLLRHPRTYGWVLAGIATSGSTTST